MTEAAETYTHNGITVELHYDTNSGNPYVEWDHASTLYVSPNVRYDLHAERTPELAERDAPVVTRWMKMRYPVALPFVICDDWMPSARLVSDDYDMTEGYVVVTEETVRREWNGDVAAAERCARAEFQTFAAWLSGEVFGYVVAPGTPEEESCWGFYGRDDVRERAAEAADYAAKERTVRIATERMYLLDPEANPYAEVS